MPRSGRWWVSVPLLLGSLSLHGCFGPRALYSCPGEALTDNMNIRWDLAQFYTEKNNKIPVNWRSAKVDGWVVSFDERKAELLEWRTKALGDNLQEGDSIFESAVGTGYSLLMALEIVFQKRGIKGLTIYGNDYVKFNVDTANFLLSHAQGVGSSLGAICLGDSSNLDYVPTNSMDLVFTGYIDPLRDPLGLFPELGVFEAYREVKALCTSNETLVTMAQRKQEKWIASWVTEMIRMAKPGKVVIVEEMGIKVCDSTDDWGGVPREWWASAVDEYNWDVEKDSLYMENSNSIAQSERYHVLMRKTEGKEL